MKVLFFIESLRAGGKERRIVELLKGLKDLKEVQIELVITREEIHYPEVHQLGIPIHIIKRRILKKDPLLFVKFYWLARKIRPDIIHVWGHMVAVYAVPTKWLLHIPILNNEITDATPNQKLIGKSIVFKASDKIIANTKAGLMAYQAPESKSGVIYNGFNFNRIASLQKPDSIRNKFKITTPHVVAMVASFSDYKDWSTYIKAAIQISSRVADITFLCIGDGDDSHYRKIAHDHSGRILFLGRQENVEAIVNVCTLGVLMTNVNNHAEGISNALMEFMALGKPVIATNFGGSVELIESGTSGYLIDAFSVVQLVDKIEYLLTHDLEREKMGEAARIRIQTSFSIESMISHFYSEYISLYKTI